jgi:bifunctional non-homologous end joining protein LigD
MKRGAIRQRPANATAMLKAGNRKISVAEPEEVLYPAAKFRRIDVIKYYAQVARWLLPHFKNRPVTLKRYPNGIHGEVFYEKDVPGFTQPWVKTFPVPRRVTPM